MCVNNWRLNGKKFADTHIGRGGWFRLAGERDPGAKAITYWEIFNKLYDSYGKEEAIKFKEMSKEVDGFWIPQFTQALERIVKENENE